PNGRLAICLAHQAQTVLDVTPSGASQCPGLSGMPMNAYPLAAVAIVPDAVLAAGATFSVRAMVQSRMTSMATQIGIPSFDPGAGQLYVHVDGPARQVSISAGHAATQSYDGTHWGAGDTGSDVLFPNVAIGASPVAVSVAGGAVGTGSYTL